MLKLIALALALRVRRTKTIPDRQLKQSRGNVDSMSFDQPKLGAKPFAIWPLEHAIRKLEAGEPL